MRFKRLTFKIAAALSTGDQYQSGLRHETRTGWAVDLLGPQAERICLHKEGGAWIATHYDSGYQAGAGRTREQAIDNAIALFMQRVAAGLPPFRATPTPASQPKPKGPPNLIGIYAPARYLL